MKTTGIKTNQAEPATSERGGNTARLKPILISLDDISDSTLQVGALSYSDLLALYDKSIGK